MRVRRKGTYENRPHAGVDLTPLIDVVFVLLVCFMVAVPFLNIDKVKLADGSAEKCKSIQEKITIHVLANNQILLNNNVIKIQNLKDALKTEKWNNPNTIPILFQDGNSSFQTYQSIKSCANEAGFNDINVVLHAK